MGAVLRVHRLQNQIESGDFTAWSQQGAGAAVKKAIALVEVEEHGGGGKQLLATSNCCNGDVKM